MMACQSEDDVAIGMDDSDSSEAPVNSYYFAATIAEVMEANESDHEETGDDNYDAASATIIQFSGNSIEITGEGVMVSGTVATINSAGTYLVSGMLDEGQLAVKTEDEGAVKIVLNNAHINNARSAPFYAVNAEKVIIFLPDGTENTFTDAEEYIYENEDDDEPNAAFFSDTDLSFYGSGKITINSNYNDGITSKDGLIIGGGNFTVNSTDDGIRGKDYLVISDGNFKINSVGDAFKSDDDDEERGYILISGGTFDITTTEGDGFTAESDLMISNGTFTILTAGGSSNYTGDASTKGLKAGVNNLLEGGIFQINSADDAIHSNGSIAIQAGTFTIATGDDGIHADEELTINGGQITISESYEGLEANLITVNDGTIHLVSSDDGVNAAGGNDSSGTRPGQGPPFQSSIDSYIYFQGGDIVVEAGGDGIDANGSISMTAGTVLVHGPTSGANGPLDYDGNFQISGGLLIAAGTSNMAQAPSSSSEQNAILVFLNQQTANTVFAVLDENNNPILAFAPSISYSSVTFSSPDLMDGGSYEIYVGGTASGTEKDGLYSDVAYSGGTKLNSFIVSSTITTLNR